MDVSIVSSFVDLNHASVSQGHNSMRAEKLKREKYEARLADRNLLFTPFIIESLGGMGSACDKILKRIGAKIAEIDHISRGISVSRIRSRLVFAAQKAAM